MGETETSTPPTRDGDILEIAGRSIGRGERVEFELPTARLYTHTPLNQTVEVIRGRREGPVLLVCAAVHGDELNGVEVIRRLSSMRAMNRLRGTLILVPIVNVFGFINRSRYLPDRRDLNRCFPGTETGSLGARVANLFYNEVVRKCTHAIDLHTGAVHRDNLPQVRAALESPEIERMARSFAIPVIINAGLIESSLRAAAAADGIPVVTFEGGEALRLDERSIVSALRGIVAVMRDLEMLPGRRTKQAPMETTVARSTSWVRAPIDGVFRATTVLGARVKKGDTLGVVGSPFSSDETTIAASTEGVVICVNRLPLVNEGEALFHIARFGEPDNVRDDIEAHASAVESDPMFDPEPNSGDADLS